jgi:hypothetical protein
MVGVKQEETGLYLSPCGILNGGTAGFLEASAVNQAESALVDISFFYVDTALLHE